MDQDSTPFSLTFARARFCRDIRKSLEIRTHPFGTCRDRRRPGRARITRMADLGPKPLGGPIVITPGSGKVVLEGVRAELAGTHTPPPVVPEFGLLLQTIVTSVGKTEDGDIIRVVAAPWRGIAQALLKDPDLAYKLDPRQLEEMVAAAWDQAGAAEVILTPRSGDLGRDVIATFEGLGTFRNVGTLWLLDQVRRYGPTTLVTAEHARALVGVIEADKATKGFLTTTSDFAPELHEDRLLKPYIGARLELVNRAKLLAWFEGLTKR